MIYKNINHKADYDIAYTIAAVKKETKEPHNRPPMRKIIIVACNGFIRVSLTFISNSLFEIGHLSKS